MAYDPELMISYTLQEFFDFTKEKTNNLEETALAVKTLKTLHDSRKRLGFY